MGFVNEFISEEGISKFGLDALMAKHDKFTWAFGRPPGFKHEWTIDRGRDAFLLTYKRGTAVGASGNPMPTSERWVWLRVGERDYHFVVDRAPGGSTSQKEVPYRINWKVISRLTDYGSEDEKQLVESLLREALVAYGFSGAWRQLASTEVNVLM